MCVCVCVRARACLCDQGVWCALSNTESSRGSILRTCDSETVDHKGMRRGMLTLESVWTGTKGCSGKLGFDVEGGDTCGLLRLLLRYDRCWVSKFGVAGWG